MKGKVSLGLGTLGLISCFFLAVDEPRSTVFKISLGLVISSLIEGCVFLIENRKKWNLFKTLILKRNQRVRATIAYLFRIEMNGRYLLVKRHKKDNVGYQPVGGAYKYLKEENRELFDRLGIEPCNYVPRDEDTENDLRVIVAKRKNLISFLKWFEGRKNREMDPTREFREELIDPGLLPDEVFKHIKYVYIGKHIEGPLKSPVYPMDELRYADIYELRLENDIQRQVIQDLTTGREEVYFATPDEIRNGATVKGDRILSHTFKILPR